jgi:hypothetical protein
MEKAFDRASREFTKKDWTHTGPALGSKNGWERCTMKRRPHEGECM